MDFPLVPDSDQQGRLGIDDLALNIAKMGLIWRETARADVGIDGQIEYVDNQKRATAKLVAAQVKSGESYFDDPVEGGWRIYPEKKHLLYWERFPIPVLLFLYSPDQDALFWVDVRQLLRSGSENVGIVVPNENRLTAGSRDDLFRNIGVNSIPFIEDMQTLMLAMIKTRTSNADFSMSYFDLFAGGLTNIVRSLYFGMDLAMTIAEGYLDRSFSEFGVGLGSTEYEFLYTYIQFLVAQHIADIDFSDCLVDWVDREMVPHFMAPLTSRGRLLVETISEQEDRLRGVGLPTSANTNARVAQERLVRIVIEPGDARFSLIVDFQEKLITEKMRKGMS